MISLWSKEELWPLELEHVGASCWIHIWEPSIVHALAIDFSLSILCRTELAVWEKCRGIFHGWSLFTSFNRRSNLSLCRNAFLERQQNTEMFFDCRFVEELMCQVLGKMSSDKNPHRSLKMAGVTLAGIRAWLLPPSALQPFRFPWRFFSSLVRPTNITQTHLLPGSFPKHW